ncbi:ABC transporter permease [Halomonas sp. ML-15]|uniref:ABC transporter permease n=1 Tax=Halomonas sp. ML-15 TaxID=2773305 RepID=UPI00174711DD|nr:ABC transporter permease [Halomonas sp. ML-15]MBD3895717.1 ABC transporter permease [Halomonas sp. ML-15]
MTTTTAARHTSNGKGQPDSQVVAPKKSEWKRAMRSLYRSKAALGSALLLILLIIVALTAQWIAPHDPRAVDISNRMLWPVWTDSNSNPIYFLGTDSLGRDILSRLIHASQMTLIVAVAAVIASGLVGIFMGLISGFFGSWMDSIIMRLADLQLAFPSLLIGLIVMALIGSGVAELIFVIALTQWAYYARIVRSEVIKVRETEYVQAARALGAGNIRLIFKHVLPNALASMLVVASFTLAIAIYYEASLSFFGLGIPPAIPTWGNMIADARDVMLRNWWFALFPGLAITFTVLAFNLLGDWVRDHFDVKAE